MYSRLSSLLLSSFASRLVTPKNCVEQISAALDNLGYITRVHPN